MVMVVLMVMMMMPEEKERLALYCPSCHNDGDGPQLSTTTEILPHAWPPSLYKCYL